MCIFITIRKKYVFYDYQVEIWIFLISGRNVYFYDSHVEIFFITIR